MTMGRKSESKAAGGPAGKDVKTGGATGEIPPVADERQRSIPLFILGLAGLLVSVLAGAGGQLPFIASLCAAACRDTAEITFMGAPVWVWGAVFWAALAFAALFKRNWASWIAVPGIGIEAALVWIMISMGAPCVFCIANAGLVAVLVPLSFTKRLFWRQLAVALVFVLAGMAWVPHENGLFAPVGAREARGGQGGRDNVVAAVIGNETITDNRLEVLVGPRLFELKKDIYRLKREKLDQLIVEHVLRHEAGERGLALEQFMDETFPPSQFTVTEQEIDRALVENQDRVRQYHGPPEELRPRLKAFLEQQKRVHAINAFAHSLGPKYGLRVYLSAPEPARTHVDVTGAPSRGPADAPVTIIEFSDYECPACRSTHDVLKKVKDVYGDRIRWVFMDYPLKRHKDAFKAAEAAHCAGDHGKFWDYQEIAFTRDKLDIDSLVKYGAELGLSAEAFRQCIDEDRHKEQVERNLKNATKAGVDRTPSFIINGVLVVGGPAFEKFRALIDEELNRKELKP